MAQSHYLIRNYETTTLDELRKKKIVSLTDGRPQTSLTDEKWQQEFHIRKAFVIPYDKNAAKLGGKYSNESGAWKEERQGVYFGCTNWQQYTAYINDILNMIRSRQVDYCYYIYQIIDLLKFHPKSLKTKYCDGYWEVWLER